ncbi:hypothetical protein KAI78_00045 [bacterium]|nr:hypothetical protein [bacterium]MCK5597996.1 hypothetical protein [bacterium]
MEIKTKKVKGMMIFYFGKEENTTLSIIAMNPQLQVTCEVENHPTNVFMALWDHSMDLNYYLDSDMKFVSQEINSGIKCLPHYEETLKKQYMEIYEELNNTSDRNMKGLMIKSLANLKAALVLIKWFNGNSDKYDFSTL